MLEVIGYLAVSFVFVLAVIALRLQRQVKKSEARKAQQESLQKEQQQAQKLEQRESMNKSIQILAKSLASDQLSKTEAAIRIGALLEFLGADDSVKEEYSAFFQLAEASAHIPILEKWKALPT
ncbi:MAG: hypothetical protein ACI9NY_002191, partial [Kiritimatiellia bacterium]